VRKPYTRYRSASAEQYRGLYHTARWQRTRAEQLKQEPLCRSCDRRDKVVPATVADHITPHRGDHDLFWHGPLQSLCAPCHDHKTSVIEARGYDNEIGVDGFPVDPSHPWFNS
jgi:5-methylcytosine-specific restriction enzyme A